MKLYIENGEVLFDFRDVDTKAALDKKASIYRDFLRGTVCSWEYTDKFKVMRMAYEPTNWLSEYGNLKRFESFLKSCFYNAKFLELIEISPAFEELLKTTEVRIKELYDIEVAKEKAKEEELKKIAEWEYLCKNGCGNCKNCYRWNDDHLCKITGNILPEKNVPGIQGKLYLLFNYKPFPTDNCPFNINNQQGEKAV